MMKQFLKINLIVLALTFPCLTTGCEAIKLNDSSSIKYPYHATNARENRIRSNWKEITEGMSKDKVNTLLGEPDKIGPLYEPNIKTGKQIGHTHVYLIQQLQEHGSFYDKDEKSVSVQYNLDGIVIAVYQTGL